MSVLNVVVTDIPRLAAPFVDEFATYGVTIVHQADAEDTLAAARERHDNEASKRNRLAAGELGLDIYGMRPALEQAGLEFVHSTEWKG
ncbi:hypothetical protein ACFFP0_16735 [Rhizobium puerariae]|uniref:Glyoxalase n=1 Tax=Rhizobium puerariae TaxID=1585791 RepID=A0ABV6ALE0_9HYPH